MSASNTNEFSMGEILCPECEENCKIKFSDFRISLYDCKNGHKKDNIDLEQFKELQKKIKTKCKCDNCQNIEEISKLIKTKFFRCLTCNKNICEKCYESHNREHSLINYEQKNNYCKNHNEKYISFCNQCKINLCPKCENEHKNGDDLIDFKKIAVDIDKSGKLDFELNIKKFQNDINEIIELLTKINNRINIYYNIYDSLVNKFETNKSNFHLINNTKEIINYNKKIIEEINKIYEEDKLYNNLNGVINIFNKKQEVIMNKIKYKIKKGEKKIKIFGNKFVKNNKTIAKLYIKEKKLI